MARFHKLNVIDVQKETRDAVVVTLMPETNEAEAFTFIQGQYLTFRKDFDGTELRRSYSICAGRDEGILQVGIKRVEGGAFSTWANENLAAGDVIEAMPPMGRFYTDIEPDVSKHYLGFAGGSGITPVLSIIKTTLDQEPLSKFTLVYANRQISSIMFREVLEDLKNTYLGRFSVLHILENEAQDIDLFHGRIDADKMEDLLTKWIDIKSVTTAFICGPEPMMLTIAESLKKSGLVDQQIKFELFASSQPGKITRKVTSETADAKAVKCEAVVTLDGTTRTFEMPKEGRSILEAALEQSMDVPYSCKAGVCSTCRAKILEGEVDMVTNHALEDYEVRQGYVLSCQCFPVTDRVVVSYDQ